MRPDRWFLGVSVLGALNTVNAYRPLARRGPGIMLAFAAGQPTTEAPVPIIAAQAAGAAAFGALGAWRSPAGRAALGLSVVSWAALVKLAFDARGAGAVLDAALAEGLGPDDRCHLPVTPPEETHLTVAQVTILRLGERKAFRARRDVPFGEYGRANQLDIWRAADLPTGARAPVLVQVHGGGWVIGTKEVQGELLLTEMARRGWVGVSINYRLSPRHRWPDHLVDVKRAIAWVRAHIAEYGGDPSFVAVTGGSAGGHLTAMAALTPGDPQFQPGFEDADTTVQAAVPFYGVYDVGDLSGTGSAHIADLWQRRVLPPGAARDRSAWEQASPLTHVGPHAPPFFVLHGTNDTLVPVEQARQFVQRLRAVSAAPVVYAELPGAQHAFDLYRSTRALHSVRAVARFLSAMHARAGLQRNQGASRRP